MKIIYAIREDYCRNKGGDSYQMYFTKKELENEYKLNISIINNVEELKNYSDFDLLHVFNLQNVDFSLKLIEEARRIGIKSVISTIYWDLTDSIYVSRIQKITSNIKIWRLFSPLKNIFIFNTFRNQYAGILYRIKMHKTISNVDAILPNSEEEAQIVKDMAFYHKCPSFVIPNSIIMSKKRYVSIDNKFNNCILEVARIEPTKNQLIVVKSCIDNDIPIVFIGAINKKYNSYYQKLKKLSEKRGNVYFLGEMSQEDIFNFYHAAKIHILPSFRESPGLSSLEALYHGCKIIVSDERFCPIKSYDFDKYACVCNPYSVSSVKKAIEKAYSKPKPEHSYDFDEFSYKNAAKKTYEAYIRVLSDGS